METAGNLPPAQSQAALAGVSAASTRSVSEKRVDLAENPPQLERPSGAPSAEERLAEEQALPPAAAALARVERASDAPAAPPIEVPPLPPAGAPVTQAIPAPVVPGGPQGEITEDDARNLQRIASGASEDRSRASSQGRPRASAGPRRKRRPREGARAAGASGRSRPWRAGGGTTRRGRADGRGEALPTRSTRDAPRGFRLFGARSPGRTPRRQPSPSGGGARGERWTGSNRTQSALHDRT